MQPVAEPSLHRASFDRFIDGRLSELASESLASGPDSRLRLVPSVVELALPWGDPEGWRRKHDSYLATVSVAVALHRSGETGPIADASLILGTVPVLTEAGTFILSGTERVPLAQLRRRPGVALQRSLGVGDLPVITARVLDAERHAFGYRLVLDGNGLPAGCEVVGASREPIALAEFLAANDLLTRAQAVFGASITALLDKSDAHRPRTVDIDVYLDEAVRRAVNERLAGSARGLGLAASNGSALSHDDMLALLGLLLAAVPGSALSTKIPGVEADDPSDLRLVKVWLVGDHLEEVWRRAMPRLRVALDDELSSLEGRITSGGGRAKRAVARGAVPSAGWARPFERRLSGMIETSFDAYLTSSLCPPLDRTNPLAELSHKRAVTRLGAGGLQSREGQVGVRGVHSSHYGRLCLLETPESDAIGLRLHLAMSGGVDEHGNLTSELTAGEEVRCFTAAEEGDVSVGPHPTVPHEAVAPCLARAGNGVVEQARPDARDARPAQPLGLAAALVPFVAHDELARASMGAKNMKQAVPLVAPQAPLVVTGAELLVTGLSHNAVLSPCGGLITEVSESQITVGQTIVPLPPRRVGNLGTCHEWRASVRVGESVVEGQLLADGPSGAGGELALGANVLVGYLSYDGANFEDGIVVSDRLVSEEVLTSKHQWERTIDLSEDEIRCADDRMPVSLERSGGRVGTVRVGETVGEGSVLVRALWLGAPGRPKHPREHLLNEPLSGTVAEVRIDEITADDDTDACRIRERITIVIEQRRPLRVGDKLTGRHGNKGVVTRIVPRDQMPRLDDGTPLDVLLNPHGVVSRLNLGQLLEVHWGWAADQLGCRFLAAPFQRVSLYQCEHPEIESEIRQCLTTAASDEDALRRVLMIASKNGKRRVAALGEALEKVRLLDPRTGAYLEQPVTVGWQYLLKLNHMAADKVHGRADGGVSRLTMQPVKGRRRGGGQRFGEMEVWGLLAHHVPELLEETLGLRADDVVAAASAGSVIPLNSYRPALPESVRALALVLRGLLINLEYERKHDGVWRDDWTYLDPSLKTEDLTALRVTLAGPHHVSRWGGGFEVKDPADLRRVVQYYCPEHGWWEATVTLADAAASWVASLSRRGDPEAQKRLLEDVRKLDRKRREDRKCPALEEVGRGGQKRCRRKPAQTRTVWAFARKGLFSTDQLPIGDSRAWRQVMGEIGLSVPLINPLLMRRGFIGRSTKEMLDVLCWRVVWEVASARLVQWQDIAPEGDYLGGCDLLDHWMQSPDVHAAHPEATKAWKAAKVTAVPVVPADFRAIEFGESGVPRPSDLHRLYSALVHANSAFGPAANGQVLPPAAVLKAKRRLQLALNALFVNGARVRSTGRRIRPLADFVQGKTGLLRQALLGKRVNFSGRAVIVGDPSLTIDECRLPRSIAERAATVFGEGDPAAAIQRRVVLLNRAPTLHRSNVMALRPKMWDHDAIGLPLLVCGGFNADFDGDTMSVHLPLLPTAQGAATAKMMPSRHVLNIAGGSIQLHLTQDIVSGAYVSSLASSSPDLRASLQAILGWDGQERLDKKRLGALIAQVVRSRGSEAAAQAADAVAGIVLERLTRWGLSLSIFDVPRMAVPERMRRMESGGTRSLEEWCVDMTGQGALQAGLASRNPLSIMVLSGARGDVRSVTQMGAARGPIQRPTGTPLPPVIGNFSDGLSPVEFYASAFGARKTLMDKKLVTAEAGYLTRLIVEAAYPEVIAAEDCGTEAGIEVRPFRHVFDSEEREAREAEAKSPSFASRLIGRVVAGAPNGVALDEDAAERLSSIALAGSGAPVLLRSPLTCALPQGICQRCYGWDPSTRQFPEVGLPVGIIAGQSIGERGTQLTMRTFHSGGIQTEDITSGLPRVRRLLSGVVDVRQVRQVGWADEPVRSEWDVRWEGGTEQFVLARHADGRTNLSRAELRNYLGRLSELWHGFYWEMSQVYGTSIDAKHLEVVLRSMLRPAAAQVSAGGQKIEPARKKPNVSLRAAIAASGGSTNFLAGAGFESAMSVLVEAAAKDEGSVDRLVSPKSRVMLVKR